MIIVCCETPKNNNFLLGAGYRSKKYMKSSKHSEFKILIIEAPQNTTRCIVVTLVCFHRIILADLEIRTSNDSPAA